MKKSRPLKALKTKAEKGKSGSIENSTRNSERLPREKLSEDLTENDSVLEHRRRRQI